MFGLNDNRQAQEDTGQDSAVPADEAQAESVLAAAAAAPHPEPPPSPVTENNVAPTPAPEPANSSTPSAPPVPVTPPQPDPTTEPAATPVEPPLPTPVPQPPVALTPESSGINGVSLENAYIATDPPHITSGQNGTSGSPTASSLVTDADHDELVRLKQDALKKLEPLVDQLEQSPEEKFKTTMMLIQASDNAELVKEAFESANQIKDEKARAQALLDVVNEINYFTQHGVETIPAAPNGA